MSSQLRVHVPLALAFLLGATRPALPAQAPLGTATRAIAGTVRDSLDGRALGAWISIRGTGIGISADQAGRFRIPAAPTGPLTLDVRYIGYPPARVDVRAGSDYVTLHVTMFAPPLRQPVPPGRFPPLTADDLRAIAIAVLPRLAGRADMEFGHTQMLGRPDSLARQPNPIRDSRVVLRLEGAPVDWRDAAWLRQLLEAGLIAGACQAPGFACPDSGFYLYFAPSAPERFGDDSVTVHIGYTAIDEARCKQGGGMGDETSENWLVVRIGGTWRLEGLDYAAPRSHGTLVCGPLR